MRQPGRPGARKATQTEDLSAAVVIRCAAWSDIEAATKLDNDQYCGLTIHLFVRLKSMKPV